MMSTNGRRGSGNCVGWVAGFPTNTKKQNAKPATVNAAEPNKRRRVKRLLFGLLPVTTGRYAPFEILMGSS
jgi:hypothetical protein